MRLTASLASLLVVFGTPAVAGPPLPALPGNDAPVTWEAVGNPPHPDGREHPIMVSAPEIASLIVMGGFTEHGYDDDLWLYDLSPARGGWRRIEPTGTGPGQIMMPGATWDPVGRRLVFFGGYRPSGGLYGIEFSSEVWGLGFDASGSTATWNRLHPGGAIDTERIPAGILVPTGRVYHSMSYDPAGRRLLVYGGMDLAAFAGSVTGGFVDSLQRPLTGRRLFKYALNDLWSFDLAGNTGWRMLSDAGIQRMMHQAAYDPVNRQFVTTGGYGPPEDSGSWYRPETESFNLAGSPGWTRWDPAGERPRFRQAASDRSASMNALLVFGMDREWDDPIDHRSIYALTLTPKGVGAAWRRLPNANFPRRPLFGTGGAMLPGPERFAILGGFLGGTGDRKDWPLWTYDLGTGRWAKPDPGLAPLPPTESASAAVSGGGFHMVGGWLNSDPAWRMDLADGSWARSGSRGVAPQDGVLVHDPTSGRLIAVEGCTVRVRTLTAEGWVDLHPTGDVAPICGPRVVPDPPRRRVLVFGGHLHSPDGGPSLQQKEVFALVFVDGAAPRWELVDAAGTTDAHIAGHAVYDPYRQRVLIPTEIGGLASLDLTGAPRWSMLATSGTSGGLYSPRAFDVANDRLLAYDGCGDGKIRVLEGLSGSPTWRELETADDPTPHCGAGVAYDPAGKRLLTYGGRVDTLKNDAYALPLGGSSVPPDHPVQPPGPGPAPAPPVVGGTWRSLGPDHAHIGDVDVLPDGRVIAATTSTTYYPPRGAGVALSSDGGATWSATLGATPGTAMTDLAAAADPSRIYAGSIARATYGTQHGTGLSISEDGGITWRLPERGLPWDTYWAVAAHPTDPLVAWAGGEGGGIFRTADGGRTWAEVTGGGLSGFWVNALATVPLGGGGVRLLAGLRQDDANVAGDGGVAISDDLGATWEIGFRAEQFVKAIAVDPSDPRRILAAEGYGVWRSDDAGLTWTHVNGNTWQEPTGDDIHLGAVEFDPASNGRVLWGGGLAYFCDFKDGFAGGSALPPFTTGVWKSIDGGRSWREVTGPHPQDSYCGIGVAADGRTIVAGGLYTGIWRSADGGKTWAQGDGIAQTEAVAVAADPSDPQTLVAALSSDGLYATRDGGETWELEMEGDHDAGVAATHVIAVPGKPGRMLAAFGGKVHRSEDGGRTWQQTSVDVASFPEMGTGLAAHPTDPNTWYAWTWSGVAVTHDNGATSDTVATGANCPRTLLVDPHQPNRVFAGDGCGKGLYVSEDAGRSWEQRSASVGRGYVLSLAADPSVPDRLYAGSQHLGVFRSDDAGQTWVRASDGLGYQDVRGIVVSGGRVLAVALDHGVFESDDAGAHWTRLDAGMPTRSGVSLSVDPLGRPLLASVRGGVARLE